MGLQFQWAAHQAANQKFGEVVLRNYCAGDVVWVQDYHLMLLPAILKSRMPKMKARRLHSPLAPWSAAKTAPHPLLLVPGCIHAQCGAVSCTPKVHLHGWRQSEGQ